MKTLGGGKTIQPSWDLNWREREVFERWVGGKISTPVLLSLISVISAQCCSVCSVLSVMTKQDNPQYGELARKTSLWMNIGTIIISNIRL